MFPIKIPNDKPAEAAEVSPRFDFDEANASAGKAFPVVLPIRALGENHRRRIARHLLDLDPRDRYLRFGISASDEQIQRYVESLNFDRDEIFGIYNRNLRLIAMAHLAYPVNEGVSACAEFGVSVDNSSRGRGFGVRLFDRAVMHARNNGVSRIFIHALTENAAMLKIARDAGAVIEQDGAESEAHLSLEPATFDTRLTELLDEQMAQADYRFKMQIKQFRDIIGAATAPHRD